MSDYQSVYHIPIYICRVRRPLCQTTSLCITYLYIFAESGGHYVRLPVCVSHTYIYLQCPEATMSDYQSVYHKFREMVMEVDADRIMGKLAR